jgi:hypothetical protein
MDLKMVDIFRIRKDRTQIDRYLELIFVQQQSPIQKFHQVYIIQLDILIG